MGSNPGPDKAVFFLGLFFFFFLLTSLSLTCTGIILDHKVTRSGIDKEREKNPSSAICVANAEIRAQYGKKVIKHWHHHTGEVLFLSLHHFLPFFLYPASIISRRGNQERSRDCLQPHVRVTDAKSAA